MGRKKSSHEGEEYLEEEGFPEDEAPEEAEQEQPRRLDETVPGGLYIVGKRVVDANGNVRADYKLSRKGEVQATGVEWTPGQQNIPEEEE